MNPAGKKNKLRAKASLYWKNRYLVILFIPAVIYYCIFHYAPLYGIQIAFKNFSAYLGIWKSPWTGFDNFKLLFGFPSFRQVFSNTIIISSLKFIFGFPAPIIFAILLNEMRIARFKKAVQTISYLPHFVSWVILAGLFIQFLSPSTGPINIFLKSIGITPIYFLASEVWFRPVLVVTSIWKGVGWGSIIYLAALSGVDPQLYEAAEIDGAGRWRKIASITLPSLIPVITISLIFSAGNLVKDDFDQIFNLYNPAVYRVGDVLGTYTYRVGLQEMRFNFSTAVGLFLNVVSFGILVLTNAITKRVNEYGLW